MVGLSWKSSVLVILLLCITICTCFTSNKSCNTQAVYYLPGDVVITALFDGHNDSNCTTPIKNGQNQINLAIDIVKMLKDAKYMPGINIGLLVYDSCSTPQRAYKAVVDAMVNIDCQQAVTLGIVTTSNIASYLSSLIEPLTLPLTVINNPLEGEVMSTLAASLAAGLGWTSIDYVLTTENRTVNSFMDAATQHRLCVHSGNLLSETMHISGESTIAVLAKRKDLQNVHLASVDTKMIYVPLDGQTEIKSDFPENTYIISPSNIGHLHYTNENMTAKFSMQTSKFLQMVADFLQIMDDFKTQLSKDCVNLTICDNFKLFHNSIKTKPVLEFPEVVRYILNLFKIQEGDIEGFSVSQKKSKEEDIYDKVASFNFNNGKLTLSLDIYNVTSLELCQSDLSDNTTGRDCSKCTNYLDVYKRHYQQQDLKDVLDWRSEAWVAAVISISSVGVLSCLAIAVFIVVRVCKHDVLEGNPSFSLLLIFSIICMYSAILPFAFKVLNKQHFLNSLLCILKIFGTNLSYTFMYSTMLARSFMISSCDQDGGFMSHINGYLQSCLCFFIAFVQVALSIQFWAIEREFLSDEQCLLMTKGYYFILFLSYNTFLLILLVCMTPFIFKSKRNYKEGMFFSIAIILCLFIWLGWCTAFLFFEEERNDFYVVIGLSGTASVILTSIFIPRTYLMTIGIVREHLASALPSLAYASTTNVSQVNYRSTHALYDSVNTIPTSDRGQSNPNYYCERSTTPTTAKMDSGPRIRVPIDNTYERYGTPPSPLNVTRF